MNEKLAKYAGRGGFTVSVLVLVFMSIAAVISDKKSTNAIKAAASIDKHVWKDLKLKNQTPNQIVSDEVFLRRVFLSIAGRSYEFAAMESGARVTVSHIRR